MALVRLCRGIFYWPPHTTILFFSIFLDKFVLDTLKSRYHRNVPVGMPLLYHIFAFLKIDFRGAPLTRLWKHGKISFVFN